MVKRELLDQIFIPYFLSKDFGLFISALRKKNLTATEQ